MIQRSLLLSAAAGYLALVGLGLIFVPKQFGIGAVPPDPAPALLAFLRIFGGPCLGIAALNWMTRASPPSAVQRNVILANAVGFATVAAVDVWGVFNGARPVAKIFLVVHVSFALAFLSALRKHADRSAA
jgi:hypothetical protein